MSGMVHTFGQMVRARRKANSLTLAEVAARIGCDHARLSRIEYNLARPTTKEVAGLVREFDLDPGEALAMADAVVLGRVEPLDVSEAAELPPEKSATEAA